ncbi:hypothetical protein IE4803_PB00156 (plasmid) [Rhizobium etli bv. phaseoli str. IE4803]|nr:hypothetical protein IE4803_PB00156 [Rhizobium etli bv. phaseoli str. IE4803]
MALEGTLTAMFGEGVALSSSATHELDALKRLPRRIFGLSRDIAATALPCRTDCLPLFAAPSCPKRH